MQIWNRWVRKRKSVRLRTNLQMMTMRRPARGRFQRVEETAVGIAKSALEGIEGAIMMRGGGGEGDLGAGQGIGEIDGGTARDLERDAGTVRDQKKGLGVTTDTSTDQGVVNTGVGTTVLAAIGNIETRRMTVHVRIGRVHVQEIDNGRGAGHHTFILIGGGELIDPLWSDYEYDTVFQNIKPDFLNDGQGFIYQGRQFIQEGYHLI